MDLIERWWNGQWGRFSRRDIWLWTDGRSWHVRGRHGDADSGREVHHEFDRDYLAHTMVDRLMEAAPGNWKNITKLVRKPENAKPPAPVDEPAGQE